MPLSYSDITRLLAQLAEEEEIRVTVRGSAWGGALTGLSAFVGGLLLGPAGLLIGGSVGGGAAYAMGRGNFQSAAAVIRELPTDQQQQLAASVGHLVRRIRAEDAVTALAMLAGTGLVDVRRLLITEVVGFLSGPMALQVVQ